MEEMDFDQQLKAMETDWDNKQKTGPNDVKEGEYLAICDKAQVVLSESSNKLMIVRRHVVVSGDLKGKTVQDYIGLTNQYGPYFINEWAKAVDVKCPKPDFAGAKNAKSDEERLKILNDSFKPLFEKAKATNVSMKVKRKDDFANVFVTPIK